MKTKKIFCVNCQDTTDQTVAIDLNGEYVFTCECGRFLKLPADFDPQTLNAVLKLHQEANEGQVSQEEIDAQNKEKLKNI